MPQPTRSLSDLLKQLLPYTKSIVGFVVILILCWMPQSAIQEPKWFHIPNADKVIHFTMFFVWAFCLQFDGYKKIKKLGRLFFLVLLAGISTAILTETLQPIVSNRTRDLLDGLFDAAGTLTAVVLFLLFLKKNPS